MYPIIIYFIYNVTIYFLFITYLYEIKRRPHSQSELAVFFFFEMYYSLLTMKMNEGKQLLFARCAVPCNNFSALLGNLNVKMGGMWRGMSKML
jgi:hypothetical protein